MSDTSYLNELNDVQQRAVTHMSGPLMVIAGPGSGKERIQTQRRHRGLPERPRMGLALQTRASEECA